MSDYHMLIYVQLDTGAWVGLAMPEPVPVSGQMLEHAQQCEECFKALDVFFGIVARLYISNFVRQCLDDGILPVSAKYSFIDSDLNELFEVECSLFSLGEDIDTRLEKLKKTTDKLARMAKRKGAPDHD